MISKIDYNVAQLFHKLYAWGGKAANIFMEGISFIAEAGILFLLIGVTLALFKRSRKIGGTILLAVALGFLFTNLILKNAIGRARPFESMSSDYYKWWLDAGATHEGGYSFPSGHTTATTAFAFAIFLATNKERSWPILILPIAMACSRIYLMVHYFTDCLGGLAVGCVCASVAYLIMHLIYKSNWRFFVWVKELEIFKSKSSPATSSNQNSAEQSPSNDYIYMTEREEQSQAGKQSKDDTTQNTSDK